MSKYIVIWQDAPGQQVSTVVDGNNNPIPRDAEYLEVNGIPTFGSEDVVHSTLDLADGTKFAITPELARATLGWEV